MFSIPICGWFGKMLTLTTTSEIDPLWLLWLCKNANGNQCPPVCSIHWNGLRLTVKKNGSRNFCTSAKLCFLQLNWLSCWSMGMCGEFKFTLNHVFAKSIIILQEVVSDWIFFVSFKDRKERLLPFCLMLQTLFISWIGYFEIYLDV